MPDDRQRRFSPELETRELKEGRLPGDTYVRVVRHHGKALRRVRPGFLRAGLSEQPRTWRGRGGLWLRRLLFGSPLMTEEEPEERVSKRAGLAIFASDNVSSSAYATEEIMRVLILAGAATLTLTMPITLLIVLVMAVVVTSYQQLIMAYPSGAGSYGVASANLGRLPGLTAASALLNDYVLTVAVSIAAGVAAITSIFPTLFEARVTLAVAFIAVMTWGNLRGIRESGRAFSAPLYVYLVAIFGLLGYGLYRYWLGELPGYEPPAAWVTEWSREPAGQALGLLLLLRAFSSGSVALTGTEAVSNGVPAFRPPEAHNARIVLILMGTFFGSIFLGMSFLSSHIGIIPDPSEQETVVSQLARTLTGAGSLYHYLVQLSTALLLVLAANTAFAGFPRLSSILASDGFFPKHFAFRADRLSFATGIVFLALIASGLIVVFQASVTRLIPLYTVGVFLAFTLSQAGMARHWWLLRESVPGWWWRLSVNGVGAVATGVVLIVVAVAKFALGAWMILLLIPAVVRLLWSISKHYQQMEQALASVPIEAADYRPYEIVVPVVGLNRATVRALRYAQRLSPHVTAVHVTDDPDAAETLRQRWDEWAGEQADQAVPLVIVESPYRSLLHPLLAYIDAIDQQSPETPVTVVLPEALPRHWWEHVLHTQTALRLKGALLFRPNTVVINVPYHVGEEDNRLPIAPT